eukprot:COSAG01_NODE_10388_length_2178_cov_1.496635_2_plen_227_part_00
MSPGLACGTDRQQAPRPTDKPPNRQTTQLTSTTCTWGPTASLDACAGVRVNDGRGTAGTAAGAGGRAGALGRRAAAAGEPRRACTASPDAHSQPLTSPAWAPFAPHAGRVCEPSRWVIDAPCPLVASHGASISPLRMAPAQEAVRSERAQAVAATQVQPPPSRTPPLPTASSCTATVLSGHRWLHHALALPCLPPAAWPVCGVRGHDRPAQLTPTPRSTDTNAPLN